MKVKKYIKYIALLLILAIGFGAYEYYRPHQNLSRANADFKIEAKQLFATFEENEGLANKKYLDKIIEVSGIVREVSKNKEGVQSINLESEDMLFGIACELDPLTETQKNKFEIGTTITLKGICTGMLSDVVLVRCVIL